MAISVTVTAAKIDVTATDVAGNTIDEIYVAVAASAFPALMVKTGASAPYTYTLPAQTELELDSGVYIKDLTVGGGNLVWGSRTANSTAILDIATGSKLELGPDWTIDFCSNSATYQTSVHNNGQTIFQGTDGNPVTLKHYYIWYIYANSATLFNDWDWVSCEDMNAGNAYWLYFASTIIRNRGEHTFNNVTFSNPSGGAFADRGFIYFSGTSDYSGITFDNIIMDGTYYAFQSFGGCFKATNSTFKNTTRQPFQLYSGGNSMQYYQIGAGTTFNKYINQQPKVTMESCTFQDNYGASEYTAGLLYNTNIKFKNCTFDETGDPPALYGVMSYNNSACLFEGTTDMTNVENKYYHGSGGGSHFDVKTLTLNVTVDGSPLEGAVVNIVEESGRYQEQMVTRSTGYIKDLFGDNPVLPYREITNNAGTTFTNWDTYTITVSYQGYTLDTRTGVDMTSDQSITVALTANAVGVTTLYDSTFYDSTIY